MYKNQKLDFAADSKLNTIRFQQCACILVAMTELFTASCTLTTKYMWATRQQELLLLSKHNIQVKIFCWGEKQLEYGYLLELRSTRQLTHGLDIDLSQKLDVGPLVNKTAITLP